MKKSEGILSNLSWKFAERITAQVVTTLVSIVLARLLDPSHYGVISIVTIFITLANTFVSDGFGSALIQKKNVDGVDYSSVLYFNVALSVVLYLILFFCAPLISMFYGEGYEILTPVLRVLGLRIILAAVNSVQSAYVSKKMIFKQFFISTLGATVASAVVGIYMAYAGYGVWALVAQYLVNTSVATIILVFTLKKRPLLVFSFSRIKELIGFGTKILTTNIVITLFNDCRSLIIGKLYSSQDLAFFDKGQQFPALIVNNINSSIKAVLFPKMANEQDDVNMIKQTAKISIRLGTYLMCPLMLGFLAVSETFVRVILTDKWIEAVPLLQIFCIFYLFQPIHSTNMQIIKAVGRGDIYLKNEIIKKVFEVITLIISVQISVKSIAIAMAFCSTSFIFINAWPNKKLIGYSIKEQLLDILPSLSIGIIMCAAVLLLGKISMPLVFKLCCQILLGMMIYVALSIVSKNKEYAIICGIIKEKLKKLDKKKK